MDVATHLLAGVSVGLLANELLGIANTPLGTLVVISAVTASVAVDLDFLAKAISLDAAWKYHRAFTHSLLAVILLSASIAGGLSVFGLARQEFVENSLALGGSNLFFLLFAAALCSSLLHLILDFCTPFPVMPFYPFSSSPVTLRLLYLVDPVVGTIFLSAILLDSIQIGFGIFLLYLALVYCSKHHALRKVGRPWVALPIPLRPWKWLFILPRESVYQFGTISPFCSTDWFEVAIVSAPGLELTPEDYARAIEGARSNPAVHGFLRIALFPRFEFRQLESTETGPGRVTLIIDDVQWWSVNRYRIMALCVEFGLDWSVSSVRETSKFAKGPLDVAEPLPLRKLTQNISSTQCRRSAS